MKKYIAMFFAAVAFCFTSCDNETEPGGTSVEKMAGEWVVSWETQNAAGEWEDALGAKTVVSTYNTASNVATEMWFADNATGQANILMSPVKVQVDYAARTFETSGEVTLEGTGFMDGPATLSITEGKVLENAATTPRGMKADSIVCFINVQGDTTYKVAGFRRTGFTEDEP